jgi:LPXTG-motif cell wall-anchored protein
MTNDLIVEVPNTETSESIIIPIISITAMILGLGVVIYANKKKKK